MNSTPAPPLGRGGFFLRVLRGPEFPGACRDSQVNSVMDAWIKSAPGKHEVSFSDDEDEPELKKTPETIRLEDVRDDTTKVPEHGLLVKQTSQDERELINLVFEAASLSKGL